MNMKIPLINEQKKIIALLEEITKKEQLLESKYQEYQKFKNYLMQQIFAQKLRFNFNDEWKIVKIKDIFDERSEKGFLDLELLSVTLNDGVLKRSEIESKDNSNENKSNYKHVLPGDIVYNSMRMWQGASGVSPYEGIVSPAYTILIPKNVYSKYFGYYFKTNEMIYLFKKYSQGLTSDTWNLKYPLISEIKIKILDEKIKILHNNIDELTMFKKGLLQQMFSYMHIIPSFHDQFPYSKCRLTCRSFQISALLSNPLQDHRIHPLQKDSFYLHKCRILELLLFWECDL